VQLHCIGRQRSTGRTLTGTTFQMAWLPVESRSRCLDISSTRDASHKTLSNHGISASLEVTSVQHAAQVPSATRCVCANCHVKRGSGEAVGKPGSPLPLRRRLQPGRPGTRRNRELWAFELSNDGPREPLRPRNRRSSYSSTLRNRQVQFRFLTSLPSWLRLSFASANPVRLQLHAATHSLPSQPHRQIHPSLVQRVPLDFKLISCLFSTLPTISHVERIARATVTIPTSPKTLRTPRTPLNTLWSTEIPARLAG
jgi:hypothetical protein